jgi:murein L,D-transpeptidase YcbB/YkuD
MKIGNIETDDLTDEQIRGLALSSAVPIEEPESPVQPRDEQGRFAPVQADPVVPPQVEAVEEEEEQPQEFVRVVDLGDGSGVQVFRGATAEEVADKLVEAQKNATRKIRSDNQELKSLQTRLAEFESRREAKPLSEDEKFILSQKFQTDPIAAQMEILERMGLSPKDLRETVQAKRVQDQINNNVAVFGQWMQSHPEFADTQSNGNKMGRYLEHFHNGVATLSSLDAAYTSLKADGLLQDTAPPTPTQQPTRMLPRTSGLSARRSVAPPPPVQEDPYEISMEELKRKANGGKSYGGW